MSDGLTQSRVKMPGTVRSKDDAIREDGQILVDAGAVEPVKEERTTGHSRRSDSRDAVQP
jgi:hypothetical protein